MKKDTTPQGGFWMLVEDLTSDFFTDETITEPASNEDSADGFDFFPDASV